MTYISKEEAVALAKEAGFLPRAAFNHEQSIVNVCNAAIEHYLAKREPLSEEQAHAVIELADWPKSMVSPFVQEKLICILRETEAAHGIGVKP